MAEHNRHSLDENMSDGTNSLSSLAHNGNSMIGSEMGAARMKENAQQMSRDELNDEEDHFTTIGAKETNRVRLSKFLVVFVLTVAAGIMAYFTYKVMSQEEQDSMETEFTNYATEIVEASVLSAQTIFATVESMSFVITSYALSTNATWPFVTIPHYSFRGFHLLELSGSRYLSFCPFVSSENRERWEEYSVANQGWINDPVPDSLFNPSSGSPSGASGGPSGTNNHGSSGGRPTGASGPADDSAGGGPPAWVTAGSDSTGRAGGTAGRPPSAGGPPLTDEQAGSQAVNVTQQGDRPTGPSRGGGGIPPFIHRLPEGASFSDSLRLPPVREEREFDDYVVSWQTTPPIQPVINLNFLSLSDGFLTVYDQVRKSNVPALSEVVIYSNSTNISRGEWPTSYIVQPIYSSFETNASMVAIFVATIPWDKYFENIVPAGVQPIDLVIKSTCKHTISYRISGHEVMHTGAGDYHDNRFDHLELSVKFSILEDTEDLDVCHYSMSLYPTEDFESEYITSTPLVYTIVVVLVFMMTSAVFILYDYLVQDRQNTVMHSAVRTNAIVTSLFPAQFRDRLIEDHDAAVKDTERHKVEGRDQIAPSRGSNLFTRGKAILRGASRLTGNVASSARNHASASRKITRRMESFVDYEAEKARLLLSEPIADLFPSVTVLFADIAGFTAWASVREPSQVFTLLEQIYSTFDAIAKRRGIFKVETIGDCYVAACGLPNPRDDHAVAMLRFARECLRQMDGCVQSLEVLLGPDTGDLTMRFGIHSGPVTAGVLRGEKTRFQLFGDTVNMAARMESTGLENRIHVSADTAKLLAANGKSHWTVARDDLVEIKGKGKVQTYWASGRSHGRGRRGSHGSVELAVSAIQIESNGIDPTTSVQTPATAKQDAAHPGTSCPMTTATSISMAGSGTPQSALGSTTPMTAGETPSPPLPSLTSPTMHRSDHTNSKQAQQGRKMQRLVGWNAEVLQGLLQKVVAMRDPRSSSSSSSSSFTRSRPNASGDHSDPANFLAVTPGDDKPDRTVLDEVKEIIELPDRASKYKCDPATVKLDPAVISELREYVTAVSQMYRQNSFHCFEHASHVVQSVTKLLSRVVTPDKRIDCISSADTNGDNRTVEWAYQQQSMNNANNTGAMPLASLSRKASTSTGRAKKLHEYTYGITSDPLTQFACAFSALIHDVDHCGVPNTVLVKEGVGIAIHYKNKSVAEQNSVDLAWELLSHDNFANLRRCICATQSELERFRQLVVNSVMATDIADKDLGALRKARWERAFAEQDDGESDYNRTCSTTDHSDTGRTSDGGQDKTSQGDQQQGRTSAKQRRLNRLMAQNRKATIVIEHLIQASDVSHTMQHWHVYLKWNERLFHEMYAAYLAGRFGEDGANPAEGWYAGELSFFDFYLIPLAKKLSTCGVFGVASDEYLNYATANRQEWERKGKDVVQRYMSKYQTQQGSQPNKK